MELSSFDQLPLVGSHLDLAENVTLFGRDLTLDGGFGLEESPREIDTVRRY